MFCKQGAMPTASQLQLYTLKQQIHAVHYLVPACVMKNMPA